ncbi:MAG TPA: prepilin-type N-terminal cleavage/methylation domain-containing protein [Thermoanaerobaculia bacterium]
MRTSNSQAGVTLVELLIALALMGIILLGIAPLFIVSVKSNYSANEYTSIHNLARDRLEQLMNLPVTDPQLAGANPCATPTSYPNDLPATLPDPTTGIPPSNVRNTLTRTYTVQNFRFPIVDITLPGAVPNGAPFVSTCIDAPGQYHYKRIDVTVTSSTMGTNLGIGYRAARVTGYLRNPDPVNNLN